METQSLESLAQSHFSFCFLVDQQVQLISPLNSLLPTSPLYLLCTSLVSGLDLTVCVCVRACTHVHTQLLSRVQLFSVPWTVACLAPLSIGILQAGILEWAAISSSRGSSGPRDRTCISCVSCLGKRILYR